MDVDTVLEGARRAKASGASRYCMGAAWRSPKDRDIDAVVEMIKGVREMGMETCMTLGMLTPDQAGRLKEAGLDYYNHNVDTSEEFYGEIITTRNFEDRIETIRHVQELMYAGGILGMGEQIGDHASMLVTLANEPAATIGADQYADTDCGHAAGRGRGCRSAGFCKPVARIMMPKSVVRLSAGREWMSDETQALCFLAGANSIFIGEALLTAANPELSKDEKLFQRLGLKPMPAHACPSAV